MRPCLSRTAASAPRGAPWIGAGLLACASGCFPGEVAPVPEGAIAYTSGPDGWWVSAVDAPPPIAGARSGPTCPDGDPARIHLVYPAGVTDPVPVAVVLHAGTFDYVPAPGDNPLAGAHYASPTRLDRAFGARQAYATLGLGAAADPTVSADGAIAIALAEQGVAMLVPEGCWGDLWHNGDGHRNLSTDGFDRQGRDAARAALQLAGDASFAAASGISLPFTPDPERVLLVGLGEGGHGVAELLWAPSDGVSPLAVLVDSSADDLGAFLAEPEAFEAEIEGLERLFPSGASVATASLAGATLPRTAYVYATLDPRIPAASHDAALAALEAVSETLVIAQRAPLHVVTAADLPVARQVAAFLLATDPIEGDTDSP